MNNPLLLPSPKNPTQTLYYICPVIHISNTRIVMSTHLNHTKYLRTHDFSLDIIFFLNSARWPLTLTQKGCSDLNTLRSLFNPSELVVKYWTCHESTRSTPYLLPNSLQSTKRHAVCTFGLSVLILLISMQTGVLTLLCLFIFGCEVFVFSFLALLAGLVVAAEQESDVLQHEICHLHSSRYSFFFSSHRTRLSVENSCPLSLREESEMTVMIVTVLLILDDTKAIDLTRSCHRTSQNHSGLSQNRFHWNIDSAKAFRFSPFRSLCRNVAPLCDENQQYRLCHRRNRPFCNMSLDSSKDEIFTSSSA